MNQTEFQDKLNTLLTRFQAILKKKDEDKLLSELTELQKNISSPDFWENQEEASSISRKAGDLQNELDLLKELKKNMFELEKLGEDASAFDDIDLVELIQADLNQVGKKIDQIELTTFLSGKFDENDCILAIHSGQGGTEANDWTEMLLRMYTRYANSVDWKVTVLDQVSGTEAGLQSVSIQVSGRFVYGYLKHEHGTHRLVRNSPFNSQGLRQTSFAGVEVTPLVNEEVDVEVDEKELEFSAMRSGGPGGQNVNKVASKVRIVHKPTGIAVESSAHRTQHQNRETAMKMLKAKLYEIEEAKHKAEMANEKGEYKVAGWGNQIRNYVLQPYKLVKDVRTQVETSQVDAVLDGDIQMFIDAEVRML